MICNKSDDDIKKVVETLKNGGIAIIPTDTVYGFSGIVDFKSNKKFNSDEKIRRIKGRDEKKPFIQLISKPEDIYLFTDIKIPENIYKLWPGALTVIVPLKKNNPLNLDYSTVAFRCPGDEWLRKIIEKCGAPIYSTSVNRSGSPVLENYNDILEEFINEVDVIVEDGDKNGSLPSTLILLENEGYKILRQGSIIIKEEF